MTSTTISRCSFIVVVLLLGLARAQEGGGDEPQAAQLRGNDDANAVLKRVDDVLDKELSILGHEVEASEGASEARFDATMDYCVSADSGTRSTKRRTCGKNAACCFEGADGTGGTNKEKENYACTGSLSAEAALALVAADFPTADVNVIQACCHTGGTDKDEGAHFTIFDGGSQEASHRDCETGKATRL